MKKLPLLLALALAAPAVAARTPPPAEGPAARLLNSVLRVPWSQRLEEFRKASPDASVEPFHGDGSVTFFHDYWSHRARRESSGIRREYYFNMPPALGESAPVLLRAKFTYGVPGPGAPRPAEVWDALHAALTRRYGACRPDPEDVPVFGVLTLWQRELWHASSGEILLYQEDGSVGLLAWSPDVVRLEKAYQDQRAMDRAVAPEWAVHKRAVLQQALTRIRQDGTPQWIALLDRWPDDPGKADTAMRFRIGIEPLREAANPERRDPDLQGALYWAANGVLPGWIDLPRCDGQTVPVEVSVLSGLGVPYYEASLNCARMRGLEIEQRLVAEVPDSPWGQAAMVELLLQGFSRVTCDQTAETFRLVIQKAPEWIPRLKDPVLQRTARLCLGRAYETWWSLAQARGDCYAGDGAWARSAGWKEARTQALSICESLVKEDPNGFEARQLRFTLPRLLAGVDTNCRHDYCIYD